MMEDFNGYTKITIEEGRPRLIKFALKKNDARWTLKNLETGTWFFIKINQENETDSILHFLNSISAYDEYTLPRTDGPIDRKLMAEGIKSGDKPIFWVPDNRLEVIKSTWELAKASTAGDSEITKCSGATMTWEEGAELNDDYEKWEDGLKEFVKSNADVLMKVLNETPWIKKEEE